MRIILILSREVSKSTQWSPTRSYWTCCTLDCRCVQNTLNPHLKHNNGFWTTNRKLGCIRTEGLDCITFLGMNRTETGNSRCVSKCLSHSILRGFLFNWLTHWKQPPQTFQGQTWTQSKWILSASAIIKLPARGLCILSVSWWTA